ncbi:MAG: TldD/PmbA family protein [archaeon]
MKLEDILSILEERGEKWMNVNQPIEIIGTPKSGMNGTAKIDFYPRQIAYCCKKEKEIELIADKGGLTTSPESCIIEDSILRTETRVGDLSNDKGKGIGYSCKKDDAPISNKDAFKRKIDEMTESSLKEGLQNYWKYHVEYAEYENDKFKKFSREEPVNYVEGQKKLSVRINRLGRILEETSEYLCKIKGVEDSIAKASIKRVDRLFISLERDFEKGIAKRIIKTSDIGAYVSIYATMRDKENKSVEYQETICDVNIGRALRKDRIWKITKELEKKVKERIDCEIQPSGGYPIIMDGRALGVLFHEGAMAHLLSARFIDEDHATTFEGKIGQKIMPEFISLYNDSTKEKQWGSYKYDEEGIQTQRIPIIENGILKNYLQDRTTSGRRNTKSNGCSRESNEDIGYSSEHLTEPRIGILEVKTSHKYRFPDLVKRMNEICKKRGLDYGLLVEGGGGEVFTGTGEFRIDPTYLYRIYIDGRIVPVSSAYILGNPYVMLNQIEMLGGKDHRGYGFCGCDSGFVHTQEIAPYGLLTNAEIRKTGEDAPRKLEKPEK